MEHDGSAGGPPPALLSHAQPQLQLVLRTPNHAAFYDRASRSVTIHASAELAHLASPSPAPQPSALLPPPPPQPRSHSLALLPHQPAGALTATSAHLAAAAATQQGPSASLHSCPTCLRPFLPAHHSAHPNTPMSESPLPTHSQAHHHHHRIPFNAPNTITAVTDDDEFVQLADGSQDDTSFVAPNYFRLLASASVPPSRTTSRPSTPITALSTDEDEEEYDDDDVDSTAVLRRQLESDLDGADAAGLYPPAGAAGRPRPLPRGLLLNSTANPSPPPSNRGVPSTPPRRPPIRQRESSSRQRLQSSQFSQGYFDRFFVRVRKLGRGARGTVWLCNHVLGGQKLGEYAVKQVPVGDYADNLLASLKEVQMLETLRHPNIIHYQHAWIEEAQTSPFAPTVPTLHVLMMAANGGSLADWISARAGNPSAPTDVPSASGARRSNSHHTDISLPGAFARRKLGAGGGGADSASSSGPPSPRLEAQRRETERLKSAIRLRRLRRHEADEGAPFPPVPGPDAAAAASGPTEPHAQHLLGEEELFSLLRDMASGLAWLHERGVLHLDVKPENVLLHWERADDLLPRAMLSDFGSSTFLQGNWRRIRSGHTGTMDFMAPEAIFLDPLTGVLQELTSKSDVWSLGMVLHLCVFFRLPYKNSEDIDGLRAEMEAYRGFSAGDERAMHRTQVPPVLSLLLARMLNRNPALRPSCEEILAALTSAATGSPGAGPERSGSGSGSGGGGTADGAIPSYAGALALRRPSAFGARELAGASTERAGARRRVLTASSSLLRERVFASPEQRRWAGVLVLAVGRTACVQWATAVRALGPGAAGLLASLIVLEVAVVSRWPRMAGWLLAASVSAQAAVLAASLAPRSYRS